MRKLYQDNGVQQGKFTIYTISHKLDSVLYLWKFHFINMYVCILTYYQWVSSIPAILSDSAPFLSYIFLAVCALHGIYDDFFQQWVPNCWHFSTTFTQYLYKNIKSFDCTMYTQFLHLFLNHYASKILYVSFLTVWAQFPAIFYILLNSVLRLISYSRAFSPQFDWFFD